MATAYTWTSLQTALAIALSQGPSPIVIANLPGDFTTLYISAIAYAENRIYRELTLLATRKQDATLSVTGGSRKLDLSAMTNPVIVPEGLSLISPASTQPAAGTRLPFEMATLDFIDLVWPVEATTMDPAQAEWIGRYWALLDASTIVLAPTPNGTFAAEVTGLYQPPALSQSNANTYLATIYPELLFAACMIFLVGALQKNFGAQSDDPRQAQSWESQYGSLRESALLEEQRRRGEGVGWSAHNPSAASQPPREG